MRSERHQRGEPVKHRSHPGEETQKRKAAANSRFAREGDFDESVLPPKSREEYQPGSKFPVTSVSGCGPAAVR